MTFSSPEFILGILGLLGIGGVSVALLTLGPTRRKLTREAENQGADAAAVVSATAITLLEPLNKQIEDLTEKNDKLTEKLQVTTDELDLARIEISRLRYEMRQIRNDAASMTAELAAYRQAASEG